LRSIHVKRIVKIVIDVNDVNEALEIFAPKGDKLSFYEYCCDCLSIYIAQI